MSAAALHELSTDAELLARTTRFLYEEARLLDERRWHEWLALYAEDCEYWVPAWKSEDEQTSDPRRSVLEDRVWRVESRRSVASMVLPRTQHLIHNVRLAGRRADGGLDMACEWTVHQYRPKERAVEMFFGRYLTTLRGGPEGWRIARRKITLLNNYLPAKIDFYSL
ncbi:MAG: nuclear transport factor 2 family protein [Candidatus Protistobacter heckmanni]|nr:nuclear transport factor 2 family protein [Candidatus Protistobacter heckmanni]